MTDEQSHPGESIPGVNVRQIPGRCIGDELNCAEFNVKSKRVHEAG